MSIASESETTLDLTGSVHVTRKEQMNRKSCGFCAAHVRVYTLAVIEPSRSNVEGLDLIWRFVELTGSRIHTDIIYAPQHRYRRERAR